MGKLQYLQDIYSNNTQDSYESFMLIQSVICRPVRLPFKSMESVDENHLKTFEVTTKPNPFTRMIHVLNFNVH